jgi:hypothetical protein
MIEVKLNMGGRKLSFLDSTPQNKEEFKKNETFYNILHEILHKTNKNDYILLSGELKDRTGNSGKLLKIWDDEIKLIVYRKL